ncbi:CDP-alcohol phosphatidyltransferase family protein [Oceanospirillaceae bacterium]|nr:CDP-alcohol phosphatidyltransferase family protein [Oceanospirillaceae bacterium]MBT4997264.1 CDP-alcohol phosphatidyltransferase family protein [Oceanospirillaceae bacterium]MBT5629890.1 CDP-alcohol phosphatidyltransferase family protein [Oceanospirillaceae bacterium]MBT7673006.1 CDP-alcohol phosphatidyltransferase family protein [Oceanospirillaceae bacterium]MDB9905943.1 CDP-alcohol phosphatidyltransferase family protein [Oceanospirillaceae bacterium]
MIDAKLLPLQRRLLRPMALGLVTFGVRADQVTITGFLLGIVALPLLASEQYIWALVFILLNRLLDGIDGEVARLTITTDRGAFLDIALDFVFYALIPLGFALANVTENALAAAVLLAAFVGTGSSFLAFSLMAEKRKLHAQKFPSKGLYYLGGLTEGAETIAVFVAFCLWPNLFTPLAYGFAFACGLTTLSRWLQGWHLLAD